MLCGDPSLRAIDEQASARSQAVRLDACAGNSLPAFIGTELGVFALIRFAVDVDELFARFTMII